MSEYDISFKPRVSLKMQAVADFVAELTPRTSKIDSKQQWTLYVDNSSNGKECGEEYFCNPLRGFGWSMQLGLFFELRMAQGM